MSVDPMWFCAGMLAAVLLGAALGVFSAIRDRNPPL